MKIRYSMLDSFLSCPLGFKKRYIDNIPDTEKSSALEYGTSIHLAIKTHFEGGDGIEVFKLFWDSLRDTPMKYYRHDWLDLRNLALNQFLPNFFRLHSKNYSDTHQENTLEMPFMGHTLSGTYDMLGKYEDVNTMVDFKTSSKAYSKNKILRNPQLYIYCALQKHNYPDMKVGQIQYKVFRKDNGSIQTLTHIVDDEIINNQMKNVESIIKSMLYCIENNVWHCNFSNEYCNHD